MFEDIFSGITCFLVNTLENYQQGKHKKLDLNHLTIVEPLMPAVVTVYVQDGCITN